MARKPSALKAVRHSIRRRILNHRRRTTIDRLVRAVRTAAKPSDKLMRELTAAIDKAAGRGVIHRRTAARIKSRLARIATRSVSEKSQTATKDNMRQSTKV